MRKSGRVLFVVLLMLVLVTSCRRDRTFSAIHVDISEVYYHHNRARLMLDEDLGQLSMDPVLVKRAQDHAEWMTDYYFRHQKLGGTSFRMMGENIAYGQQSEEDVVYEAWMKSKGHRENILRTSFTHMGAGFAQSDSGVPYWCVVFGGGKSEEYWMVYAMEP